MGGSGEVTLCWVLWWFPFRWSHLRVPWRGPLACPLGKVFKWSPEGRPLVGFLLRVVSERVIWKKSPGGIHL